MAFGSMNSGEDAPMSDINVTPLVDVMLVLLIVFMITMPVLTHSIPLQLPTASEHAKQQEQPKDPLRLSIDANGAYYLGTDTKGSVWMNWARSCKRRRRKTGTPFWPSPPIKKCLTILWPKP